MSNQDLELSNEYEKKKVIYLVYFLVSNTFNAMQEAVSHQ